MSGEMELLKALCDALGFDVYKELDYQDRKETQNSAMRYNRCDPKVDRTLVCSPDRGMALSIDDDGMYTSQLKSPVITYKLTKREPE